MKFQILRGRSAAQPFYWVIVASNGQVLATSETYVRKSSAQSAIDSVKGGALGAPTEDLS